MPATILISAPPTQKTTKTISRNAAVAIGSAVHTLFGCLLLIGSFYLGLCYITFNFYGALNSPFFAWLRNGALVAQILYFPAFAAALLAIDSDAHKSLWRRLGGTLLVLQVISGFVLYFSHGLTSPFGWALVYGPHFRRPLGTEYTYVEAVACLVPLAWISAIRVAASIRVTGWNSVVRRSQLTSFLIAGIASSLLYAGAAKLRMVGSGEFSSFGAVVFSIAVNLELLLGIFLFLEWTGLLAGRTQNPRLTQFAIRCVAIWLGVAVVLRRIVFALLGFNSTFADIYAAAFSFTAVLFIAGQILNGRQRRSQKNLERVAPVGAPRAWTPRIFALAGILLFFYVFAIKLVSIDWGHIIGSFTALLVELGLLWFFLKIFPDSRSYKVGSLLLLSLASLAGVVVIKKAENSENLGPSLERYADYNSSFFAVRQAFTPEVNDDQYKAWYEFLERHANIRQPIQVPAVQLAGTLKRSRLEKPNIFVFVIDALRRDYVSAYNPSVNFTPAIGAFSSESVVFRHAYSPYAGTALADASLWSGYQQINKIFPQPVSRLNNLQQMLEIDNYDSYVSFNPVVAMLLRGAKGVTELSTNLPNDDQQRLGPVIQVLERDLKERKDSGNPVFVFTQPANVHTLSLAWHHEIESKPHPGFEGQYATAVERVDKSFGEFIDFLKKEGLYENSVVILTADHGESLGEMGRESHVANLSPQVIQIPLIIHLPNRLKSHLVWDANKVVTLHDITPTLYYLLGHRPVESDNEMVGHPLFTVDAAKQHRKEPGHYFFMSSYMPVFGILSADQKELFYVDATLHRNYYYDLEHDPRALKNEITAPIRDRYESLVRQNLKQIDAFYSVNGLN